MYYFKRVKNTPAATADPITPATFGPIAAISRLTLPSVSLDTNDWTTRADIGTAETPAAPMQGLIFFDAGKKIFIAFAKRIPPAVLNENATAPSIKIKIVRGCKKLAPSIVAPMVIPRKRVTILIKAPPAVLLSRSVTPVSVNRFPNINIPIRGAQVGTAREANTPVKMGNKMTAVFETGMAWGMSIARSFELVSILMIGG